MDWLFASMLIFYVCAVAGAVALKKKMSWPTLAIMGAAAIASVSHSGFATWESQVVWTMGIDGLVCFSFLQLWVRNGDMKAWAAGVLGATNNLVAIAVLCVPELASWNLYRFYVNAVFAAQVLCGGGYCDALGAWLDNCLLRIAPKRHKLLRIGS